MRLDDLIEECRTAVPAARWYVWRWIGDGLRLPGVRQAGPFELAVAQQEAVTLNGPGRSIFVVADATGHPPSE